MRVLATLKLYETPPPEEVLEYTLPLFAKHSESFQRMVDLFSNYRHEERPLRRQNVEEEGQRMAVNSLIAHKVAFELFDGRILPHKMASRFVGDIKRNVSQEHLELIRGFIEDKGGHYVLSKTELAFVRGDKVKTMEPDSYLRTFATLERAVVRFDVVHVDGVLFTREYMAKLVDRAIE